jgi:putative membrane protein
MKRISAFLLIATVCVVQACNNNNGNTHHTDSSYTNTQSNAQDTTMSNSNMNNNNDTTSSSTVPSKPVGKDVADFTMKAATGGMLEVQLGQIAQTKAVDPRIRDFGSMMLKDHSAANDELKRLADSKHITIPGTLSADDMNKINDLNKKTGKDFDKAYMSMMLDDHKKDIKEFEKAGTSISDPDIKNFAMKTLPTLQKHLDSAKAIENGRK